MRFCGQTYDQTSGRLSGTPFAIGETRITSIPGFNSSTTVPGGANWALASVSFKPKPHADTYLVFWVVVWMEDAQGNLVPEMPDHGLRANPANMAFTRLTDVPAELDVCGLAPRRRT